MVSGLHRSIWASPPSPEARNTGRNVDLQSDRRNTSHTNTGRHNQEFQQPQQHAAGSASPSHADLGPRVRAPPATSSPYNSIRPQVGLADSIWANAVSNTNNSPDRAGKPRQSDDDQRDNSQRGKGKRGNGQRGNGQQENGQQGSGQQGNGHRGNGPEPEPVPICSLRCDLLLEKDVDRLPCAHCFCVECLYQSFAQGNNRSCPTCGHQS